MKRTISLIIIYLKYKILLYSWTSLKRTTLKLSSSNLYPIEESHTRLPETQVINQTLKLIRKIKIFNLILCKKSNFIQSPIVMYLFINIVQIYQ